jgi:hypothetical protein
MGSQLGQNLADRGLSRLEYLGSAREAANFEQQGEHAQMPQADVIFVHGLVSDLIPKSNDVHSISPRGALGTCAVSCRQRTRRCIPRSVGEPPVRMVLSNAGDHLHIDEPNAAVSAR